MKKSVYSPHPGFAMEEASIAKLQTKTGKSLDQWLAILKKSGPPTEKERREWLKNEHGFTTNYAWFVAERAGDNRSLLEQYDPYALVQDIFAGPKAAFKPVYEAILAFGLKLGKDVKVCPGKTMIPFYRKHVFAQVKIPNRSRLDLGFALKDTPVKGRLMVRDRLLAPWMRRTTQHDMSLRCKTPPSRRLVRVCVHRARLERPGRKLSTPSPNIRNSEFELTHKLKASYTSGG